MSNNISSTRALRVLSDERGRLLSEYRARLDRYYEQHPTLRNHTRLEGIGINTDKKCQSIYADVVLDCIRLWIRVKDFKTKNIYEMVRDDIGISQSSFYDLLSRRRKPYSLETKLNLIAPFLSENRVDYRLCEQRFQQGIERMTRTWREAIREAEMYVNAWIAGQRIDKGEPGRLISNADYYIRARAMIEKGKAKNISDASRKIAEQTGQIPETVRKKINRGKSQSWDRI